MHEDLGRREEIRGSSDRSFGLMMVAFFALLGLLPLLAGQTVHWWLLGIAAVFLGLALVWTKPLAPLNWLWIRLGLALFHVVNPVVLGLLFYGVITPIGLIRRTLGQDPIRSQEPVDSYWIKREPPGPQPETMKNQF